MNLKKATQNIQIFILKKKCIFLALAVIYIIIFYNNNGLSGVLPNQSFKNYYKKFITSNKSNTKNKSLFKVYFRNDLFNTIDKIIDCKQQQQSIKNLENLKNNINFHDRGLHLEILKIANKPSNNNLKNISLANIASDIATYNIKHSTVYNKCSDKKNNDKYWFVSLNAPSKSNNTQLKKLIKENCRSARIDTISKTPNNTNQNKQLNKKTYHSQLILNSTDNIKDLQNFYSYWHNIVNNHSLVNSNYSKTNKNLILSTLSCYPKFDKSQAAIIWYTFKKNKHDPLYNQFKKLKKSNIVNINKIKNNNYDYLYYLINKMRYYHGVEKLKWSKKSYLNNFAKQLNKNDNLVHNNKLLKKLLKMSYKQKDQRRYLSELKILASSMDMAIKNIINSASHRNSLLKSSARHVGLSIKDMPKSNHHQTNNNYLIVILLAGNDSS